MYFNWYQSAFYRSLRRLFDLNAAAYFQTHAYHRRIIRQRHVQMKIPRHVPKD